MLWEKIKNGMLKHPEQIIEDKDKKLTFMQTMQEAESLAKTLCPGRYAVLCNSEFNTGIAILACFAAGVPAIPLSSRYGEQHCNRIIKLTEPHYLLTDKHGALSIERCEVTGDTAPTADCALLMCTSGTTGVPKGAMITEENLSANLADIDRYFDLRCTDTILIARPLYHCAVLTGEFLISLLRGVHIRFYSEVFNPVALAEELQKGVSVLCATPTVFSSLARVSVRLSNPLPLRLIVSSGECMTKEVAASLRQAFPHTRIMNVYGLTEASPRVAYLPPELFDRYPEFVGFPLHSLSAKIVNDVGDEMPAGTDGELIIKGPSIMSGYYRDPKRSDQVIRDGWLHTGDIAYMDSDGKIAIRCRKDNMIILAGINIYPQEIENALCEDPDIAEVLAYSACDHAGRRHIGIRVVSNKLSKKDVLEICRKVLPSYEQPTIIDLVDRLPRNASGKLLRPKGDVQL